jgi:formylglycine-generating enzyme required for sulfatase activity
MKKYSILSLALIGLSLLFIAAKKSKTPTFELSKIEKTFGKVDSNLYASIYEVNNIQYQTFLKELKAESNSKAYDIAKVDSTNWRSETNYCEPFVDYYQGHPAYANYPVVNISYEGAQLFCKWLTQKYNSYPKRKFKKVLIRLPNKEEWQKAAIGTMQYVPYPWGGPNVVGKCNFHRVYQASIHFDKEKNEYVLSKSQKGGVAGNLTDDYLATAPVDSYKANSIGLYNISGNAAEMIQEKGIACGGGWRSCGYDVRIEATENYTQSDIDLGFRYFIEIIEE